MAHATTAPHDYAQDVSPRREFSAFLRLCQGGAARPVWHVEDSPGGTMISVGADAACDWQVRAAFVPARAFSVLVVGGRAFVRSGPEPGLLLDGRPVGDGWTSLPARSRIDIGLARFEVQTGFVDTENQEPVIELSRPRRQHDDVELRSAAAVVPPHGPRRKATMETQEYGREMRSENSRVQRVGVPAQERVVTVPVQEPMVTPSSASSGARRQPMRNSTIELRLDDLDYVGTIPLSHRGNSAEYAVSPSLLGADETTRVTGGLQAWRLVGMATFFAGAYGAWLYLLDRL